MSLKTMTNSGVVLAGALVGALAAPLAALAQWSGRGGGATGWCPFTGYGGGWLGGIPMILVWAIVIVGGIFLIRWLIGLGKGGAVQSQSRAGDIMAERYAKGEITREEYHAMKKDLA